MTKPLLYWILTKQKIIMNNEIEHMYNTFYNSILIYEESACTWYWKLKLFSDINGTVNLTVIQLIQH